MNRFEGDLLVTNPPSPDFANFCHCFEKSRWISVLADWLRLWHFRSSVLYQMKSFLKMETVFYGHGETGLVGCWMASFSSAIQLLWNLFATDHFTSIGFFDPHLNPRPIKNWLTCFVVALWSNAYYVPYENSFLHSPDILGPETGILRLESTLCT